ncbi:MAG: hypothetical protein IPM64_07365 [Phycisphaerales bacterium]|nr:hypothetical protein [Phycisphaerales bacterium]
MAPIASIVLSNSSESTAGTPLAIEVEISGLQPPLRELLIVQSSQKVRCFDLTGIDVDSACLSTIQISVPRWVYPPGEAVFQSLAASPTIAAPSNTSDSRYVLAIGRRPDRNNDVELVWLDPASGQELVHKQVWANHPTMRLTTTPAVGPVEEARLPGEPVRNMVSVGLHESNPPQPNLKAFLVDPLATYSGQAIMARNWGSPVLHENGDLIYPDDGAFVNAFDNQLTSVLPTRWTAPMEANVISCTAGVSPDRRVVYWLESSGILRGVLDPESATGTPVFTTGSGAIPATVGGSPALDGGTRWFINSDVSRRVYARYGSRFNPGNGNFLAAWLLPNGQAAEFVPPTVSWSSAGLPRIDDLASPFHAGIAIDEDGTLICVNEGYILALRPLLGDLNGDGCRNNFDIDAFLLALAGPADPSDPTWEEAYGAPIGINLLGVGDCNNDGAFDNFDIQPFVDLMLSGPLYCPAGEDPAPEIPCERSFASSSLHQQSTNDDTGSPSESLTREQVIEELAPAYQHFGMPLP